jgi:nitrate reductase alpha subunit
LWEKGYQFYCVTPKTRHRVHSQWSVNDWVQIYESNFGIRTGWINERRGGEHQLHINPQAAKDRGINDGDYIYVDGNPVDRPYRGWKPSDPYYKVARLMIRADTIRPIRTMSRWPSTRLRVDPQVVKGHETRPDGRAIAVDTGYQSNFRYEPNSPYEKLVDADASDRLLPGKHAIAWKFKWGYQVDHHAINTVPKECLIRITKAEDGGIGPAGLGAGADRLYAGPRE